MSATLGSGTRMGWNRRSRAGSFSMLVRYSSTVVAPITWSSPLASAGLRMLPASIEESPPAPAPTMVCTSSTKRTTLPSAARTSSMTFFSRSSNSPRYFVPATMPARSRVTTRRSASGSGTSLLTMRWAMPATMAVLPTPGSPISTGLFLVRRDSTSMVWSISSSRPTTGSSLPSRADRVRSRPYWSRVGVLLVAPARPPSPPPARPSPPEVPSPRSACPAGVSALAARPSRMWSGPM